MSNRTDLKKASLGLEDIESQLATIQARITSESASLLIGRSRAMLRGGIANLTTAMAFAVDAVIDNPTVGERQ